MTAQITVLIPSGVSAWEINTDLDALCQPHVQDINDLIEVFSDYIRFCNVTDCLLLLSFCLAKA